MSQKIEETSFLEGCIAKKRSVQEIHEALGLYSETNGPRKRTEFVFEEANELHEKVKEHAGVFRSAYRNEREKLLADLVKDGMLDKEVKQLGDDYGRKLWTQGKVPSELDWDVERDRYTISFYLRCWITRYAVQTLASRTPNSRKGKARADAATASELSDNEYPDPEHPNDAQASTSATLPILPFRAPDAPGMHPLTGPRAETTTTQVGPVDETVLDVAHRSEARSPVTPNKRKAMSSQGPPSSGKLQKVIKDGRAATGSPQARRGDIYDLPMSPPRQLQLQLTNLESRERSHRGNTVDSDRTWAPEPPRGGNAGSDTEIDPDEVMANTQELLSDVQIASDDDRSPTVGPSGTYRVPQRQDSMIPPSTQQASTDPADDQASKLQYVGLQTSSEIWHSTLMSTLHVDISKIDHWQEKQLRIELFKLLLSYLNYINEFKPDAYQSEAEDRMNNLLYQFWINDADTLSSKMSDRFSIYRASLERWMNMRDLLSKFQRTSGYFGRPGDGWKEHLKRMTGIVDRARANIAFVDLKSFSAGVDKATFDEDLMTVFDCLTQVEGSNGVEAFDALRHFNEGLLEWFS